MERSWPPPEVRYKSRFWKGPVQISVQGIEFNVRAVSMFEHIRTGRYPLHVHPHAELYFTMAGAGTLHVPERKLDILCEPGCLSVLPPSVPHFTDWVIPKSRQPWRLIVFNFDIAVDIGQILAGAGEMVDLAFAPFYEWFFIRKQASLALESRDDRAPIFAVFNELYETIADPTYGVGADVVAVLIRAVSLISRHLRRKGMADGASVVLPAPGKESALLKSRVLLEQGESPDAGSVTRIAKAVGMSKSHFIRSFKQAYGTTPKQYHLYVLMRRAAALIVQTDMSVKEIAYHFGYKDPTTFSRAFRKYFGVSPTEYQLKNRRT